MNGSVSVITFSVFLLLVYGEAIDFSKLILLKLSIISRKFLMDWDVLCIILCHLEIEII